MKQILLLSFLIISCSVSAQQALPIKQYEVSINANIVGNTKSIHQLLQKVCVADSVMYNKLKKVYCVYTKKELNQNIIDGKLQKNATPMGGFLYVGESDKDLLK